MITDPMETAWSERDTRSEHAETLALRFIQERGSRVVLAYLSWRHGRTRDAHDLITPVLHDLKVGEPSVWYARALNVAACVAHGMNHIDQALSHLEEQIRVSRLIRDTRLEAIGLHDFAAIIRAAHPVRAEQLLLDVIRIFEREPEPIGLPVAQFNLGNIYQEAGALETAVQFYFAALEAPGDVLKPVIETLILSSLFPLLETLGYDRELRIYRARLYALLRSTQDINVQAQAWIALSRHAAPAEIIEHVSALLPKLEAMDNHEYLALLYARLSEAYEALGNHADGLRTLRRSAQYEKVASEAQWRHARKLFESFLAWEEAERNHTHLLNYARQLEVEHAELTMLSRTDPLTGLANRHLLRERLEAWAGQDGALSLALIDIDLFKQVNDRWGHPAGDRVIQAIARLLQGVATPADLIVRYGGEEFLFVRFGGGSVVPACRQILDGVNGLVFHEGRDTFSVTVSIGVALDGQDFIRLIERADRNLYEVKQGGRNSLKV
ncbi:sensor domain-containing diguanylate cyclase [Deinococcus actinosclerus]|uniref:GGDEF domain-containing protein n=1 Tax=Deinococcus actinosclerus TaxID=1768108 RepID=A0ABM5X3S9_9DEIO|nr:GGDEF domain-containing protein [Deinococcus actinosclerus]ALW88309.1 hypothetical protein AUC44_04885 [Deinococcus actinosclerus]